MQWSLQSNVRRTQLRFSWAASSWDRRRPCGRRRRGVSSLRSACSRVSHADAWADLPEVRFFGSGRQTSGKGLPFAGWRASLSSTRRSRWRSDFIDYPYFADLGAVQLAAVVLRGRVTTSPGGCVRAPRLLARRGAPTGARTWAHRSPRSSTRAGVGAAPTSSSSPTRRFTVRPRATTSWRRSSQGYARRTATCPSCSRTSTSPGSTTSKRRATTCSRATRRPAPWVKYEGEVTVLALIDAVLRGDRPAGTHRGLGSAAASTRSPSCVGPRRPPALRRVPRAHRASARSRRMGVPHRRTDPPARHVARLPLPLRALQLEPGPRARRAQDAAAALPATSARAPGAASSATTARRGWRCSTSSST